MSRQERSLDHRARMRHDMDRVLLEYGISPLTLFGAEQYHELLEELTECGMFHVELLLIEATR